jgi:hypothetical protein
MKYRIAYPPYVWLVSVLAGASLNYWGYLLIIDPLPVTSRRLMDALPTFLPSIIVCTLFSIPTFILLWLSIHILASKTALNNLSLKTWIAIVAVVLCASTFLYFGALDDPYALNVFLCFAMPLVFSVYFFKLRD